MMKNIEKENTFRIKLVLGWILLYLAIFLLLFSHATTQLDPDLGWHLRIGADITQSKNVPKIEKYTYPTLGQQWVDHEWLSNLLLYQFYTFSTHGYLISSVLFSLIFIVILVLIVSTTRKYIIVETDPEMFFLISLLILPLVTVVILPFFGIRLQVLSWLFVVLTAWILAKVFFEKSIKPLFFLPVIFVFWSNMHGSFPLGLALLGFFILFLQKAFNKKEKWRLLIIFLACFLATLISPYFIDLWKLISEEYGTNRYYMSHIKEWIPIYAPPYFMWLALSFVAFFVTLLFLVGSSALLPKKFGLASYLVFISFLLLLSFQSRRFFPYFTFFFFARLTFSLETALLSEQQNDKNHFPSLNFHTSFFRNFKNNQFPPDNRSSSFFTKLNLRAS